MMTSKKISFIYESNKLSMEDLKNEGFSEEETITLINERILIPIASQNYTLNFVGVIATKEKIFGVLPKYVSRSKIYEENLQKMALIVQVIKAYSNKGREDTEADLLNISQQGRLTSELSIADFIISDYFRYGIYNKNFNELALNGTGEISWESTINNLTPFISLGRPVYLDMYTTESFIDTANNISRMHRWAVSYCIKNYSGLLGIECDKPYFSAEDIEDIGEEHFLTSVLNRELHSVFSDRAISVLRAILELIGIRLSTSELDLSIYGSTSFEYIWEEACRVTFKSQHADYQKHIPKPKWKAIGFPSIEEKTLRPDIVRTVNGSRKIFFIMDAKYYDIRFEHGKILKNPGVMDITKQMFYKKALSKVSGDYEIHNIFLFPSELNDTVFNVFGYVNLDIWGLDPVILVYLSAKQIFEIYLASGEISSKELFKLADAASKIYKIM